MIRPSLIALFLAPAVHAQLVITEINSNGTPADFWELTNFGESPVNIGGYKWDDDSNNPNDPAALTVPAGTTIAPGESVVFAIATTEAAFRSAWSLPSSVKVIVGGPGLGGDDKIHFYNASNVLVTSLGYAAGGFTRSTGAAALGGHAGASAGGAGTQSLIWDPNFGIVSRRYTFATGVNFETYAANAPNNAVGSPGKVGSPVANTPPFFTGPVRTYWTQGKSLAFSTFRVQAGDSDPGQSVTLAVQNKPAWLGINPAGTGLMALSGTPGAGQVGDHTFTIRATDNAPVPVFTERTYTLTVFPTTAPIILNEYNAVGTGDTLDDGAGNDSFFGTIQGNGGDWFELVVVGNGTAASTLDLRGWKIDITASGGTRTLVLSADPYWSNVPAGTILTFIENDTARGGLDTGINRVSARNTTGYLWTNIWIHDPVFIDQATSNVAGGIDIDQNDTQFTIRNAADAVVFGPAGEGIAMEDTNSDSYPDTLIGVSSTEVLRLQADPVPSIDPLFGNYEDGGTSTFGGRNVWSSGTRTQSFAPYVAANTPPRFTSSPVRYATGSYSYAVTAVDPNGAAPTLSASGLPSFLTFTPGAAGAGTLASNRSLTLDDAGDHVIRIVATDSGGAVTPQAFVLTVLNPSPAVVLNEYNAVGPGNFLNGGDAAADSDGPPAASDVHFGRVLGNGGDWFELVVVGDGTAGTVDLRGWRIEIGRGEAFAAHSTLVLSDAAAWSAVPTGTILTFIDRNTAQGGLDTGIAIRDRRRTVGDTWTNVWVGDPQLLVYTDEATNGYVLADGVVSGVGIDEDDTRFRIKDAGGRVVFGPVGEGVAPLSGVSSTEVFELQGNPMPAVSPLVVAAPGVPGYADRASASSFGWPNVWGASVTQDFSPYVYSATPFEEWAEAAELTGDDALPGADPDEDGRDNLSEYAFGGNPALADGAFPSGELVPGGEVEWTYVRRGDDPSLAYSHEASTNLDGWAPVAGQVISSEAVDGQAGYVRVTVRFARPVPAPDRWFLRARAGF